MHGMPGFAEQSSPISPARPSALTIADLRSKHATADEFCMEVQNFVDEAGIPAINELRNVGFHLLRAIDDNGSVVDQSELDKAVQHAKRACYEASEAGILSALEKIKKFKTDYSKVAVGQVIKDYTALLIKTDEALKMIEKGRQPGSDRTSDFEVRMTTFRTLRDHCQILDAGREEMNKAVGVERRDARRFVQTVIIGVAGILAVVFFGVVPFLHSDSPTPTTVTVVPPTKAMVLPAPVEPKKDRLTHRPDQQ